MTVLSAVLDWLGHALVCGTALALLTATLLWCSGRRLPLWAHGVLWTTVLAKFLMPAWPRSPWSIEHAVVRASDWFTAVPAAARAVSTGGTSLRDLVWVLLGQDQAPVSGTPVGPSWGAWLAIGYLAGLVMIFGWRWRRLTLFRQTCQAFPVANRHTHQFVTDLCRRCGCKRNIDVRVVDQQMSPFIFGLWRPTLVIPRELLSRPEELEAVVLHEVAHLRRGDMWVRQVQWIAGTVLFFWPVVAWVNRRLDLVREHACDAWALQRARLSPGDYARCLLRASRGSAPGLWARRTAAMAANPQTIERRIDMILDSPRRGALRRATWPAVGLLGLWCVVTLTSAGAHEPEVAEARASGEVVITADAVIDIDDADGIVEIEGVPVDGTFEVLLAPMSGAWHPAPGEGLTHIVTRLHEDDYAIEHGVFVTRADETLEGALAMTVHQRATSLQQFARDYPSADVDGDGNVSRTEYHAYLVAVALADPDAVLAAFAHADRDGDGLLAGDEAARLIGSGAVMHHLHRSRDHVVTQELDDESGTQRFGVLSRRPVDKSAENQAFVELHEHPVQAVSEWLLENIDYRPDADEVAEWLNVVEAAPMTALLERHPEADTDGDGTLSDDELETFLRDTLGVHLLLRDAAAGGDYEVMRIHGGVKPIDAKVRLEFIGEDGSTITLDPAADNVWVGEDDE